MENLTDNKITLHFYCTIHSKIESQDFSLYGNGSLVRSTAQVLEEKAIAYIITVTINGVTSDETNMYRELVLAPQLVTRKDGNRANSIEVIMNELEVIMNEINEMFSELAQIRKD